ncbi:MAG: hypothetical protein GWP05_05325 [Anaerolineaceae bacterium]|nr:hypothetical protein [Anaerolineaceae bacterium]
MPESVKRMLARCAGVMVLAGLGGVAWGQDEEPAAEPPPEHALAKAKEAEKKFYENIKRMVLRYGPGDVAGRAAQPGFGEKIGTAVAPMLETQIWGYRYSGDRAWLDRFALIVEALMKQLSDDPDGFKGWYSGADQRGFHSRWPTVWPDGYRAAFQGPEARLLAAVVELPLEIKANADLQETYGRKAEAWVELIEEKILPKWRKQSLLVGLSEDRAVFTYPVRAMKQGQSGWVDYPGLLRKEDNITLPHPDTSDIARLQLKLWQLDGDREHRRLAARLMRWQKSCLRPGKHNSYWWNYWDPAEEFDFRPAGGLAFGMYVAPDPVQCLRDVEAMVEAYHSGVVIDKEDLRRLAATQTRIMAKGDPERPSWKGPRGKKRGMLWPQLAEFDDRLEEFFMARQDARQFNYGGPLRTLQEKLRWGGWKRRKLGEAEVIRFRMTFKDFKKEMETLIRTHPPPDPNKNRKNRGGR